MTALEFHGCLLLSVLVAASAVWWRHRATSAELPGCRLAEAMNGGPLGAGERSPAGTLLDVTRCVPDSAYQLTVAR